ncbi:MAG: hypothetical protein GY896_20980 [Gammaproteobacteria bacterium]|nr:hypothetical protein [Gammaproteobacteria bacterium]
MKRLTPGIALVLLIGNLAGIGTAGASGDEAAYKMAHADAVAALDMAKKVGGEWRDARWKKSKAVKVEVEGKTKKMSNLAAAEAYAKMGDYEKATQYADIAKFQGVAGYQQAMDQKNAGPQF